MLLGRSGKQNDRRIQGVNEGRLTEPPFWHGSGCSIDPEPRME